MAYKMSAAQKKAVGRRMKKFWAERRANGHAPKPKATRKSKRRAPARALETAKGGGVICDADTMQLARLGAQVRLSELDTERVKLLKLLKSA